MGVRYFKTFNNDGHALLIREGFAQPTGDLADGFHQRPVVFSWQVPDVVDRLLGNDDDHAGLDGVDINNRQRLIVLVDFVAGYLTLDNFGEN